MQQAKSQQLFEQAQKYIPGGVNSPVRAYGAVGGTPPFLVRGKGPHLWDADGNRYIDYVGSWGSLILGHADPGVLRAVRAAAARGTSFGAPTEAEIDWADAVRRALPSIEQVRMVSSGTEATMSAIRLARAATGRSRVLKFTGCYHGHSDGLLVSAGSGVATLGIPGSAGVPESMTRLTVQAAYNDLAAVAQACGIAESHGLRDAAGLDAVLPIVRGAPGPVFAAIKVKAETLPRVLPPRDGAYLKDRFRKAVLGTA